MELRRYSDLWEYQVISLKEGKVISDGVTPDFEQSRNEALAAAKRLAPSIAWDSVPWEPLQTAGQ